MLACIKQVTNQSILELAPYIPGRSVSSVQRQYGLQEVVKLGSNENPLGPSPQALQAVQAALSEGNMYPDPDSHALRHTLADFCGVAQNQLVMGNGSDNLLDLMGLIFSGPNTEVLMSQYAFANFLITAKIHHATPVIVPAKNWHHDLPAIADAITEKTRLIFFANPNNPTGTYFTHDELVTFLAKVPNHVVVVLDEAYYEFARHRTDYPNAVSLLAQYPNLVVTRTFSKIYGLAGLRIGYAIAHPDIIDLVNRVRLPFNINTLGQFAGVAALSDSQHLDATLQLCREELPKFEATWRECGWSYIPSVANFSTVDVGDNASTLFECLLKQGLIVRPLKPYGMPNHLRISIGLPADNQKLLSALKRGI